MNEGIGLVLFLLCWAHGCIVGHAVGWGKGWKEHGELRDKFEPSKWSFKK